jgi:putative alpha-1,2-mannosidase
MRKLPSSAATPGYFTTKFVNGIQIETTSTRRAGLIRFTFPDPGTNHVVVDLAHDLGRSFSGGSISIDSEGRVELSGTFLQVCDQ